MTADQDSTYGSRGKDGHMGKYNTSDLADKDTSQRRGSGSSKRQSSGSISATQSRYSSADSYNGKANNLTNGVVRGYNDQGGNNQGNIDDEEEEEAENECEVEFEFEQAMDEDGVPLPYNIMAYVDEPEAGTYYFWSFGDGNESDEPNPTHIYDEVGNYEVCLTVSQMIGNLLECTSTYCDTLMIDMDGLVRQQMVLNILFPGQTINAVAEQEKTLKVHPNPAAVNFRVLSEAGIESVVARTMDGRWVGRWVSNGRQTMEVPCNAWPTGAYVLEVRTSEGVMRSRVLVQH